MPRTFKQWNPSAAELELLHECWLARLPPARIAVMSQFEFQLSTQSGPSAFCRNQADGVESRVNRIPLRPVPP